MKVKQKNNDKVSIDDYYADAASIWKRDQQERTVLDLWLHVVDHAAKVVEAVRKERPREVIDDLADTAMWLFSFLAQCQYSKNEPDPLFRITSGPSDLIWNKYPGMCPACFDFEMTAKLTELSERKVGKEAESAQSQASVIDAFLQSKATAYSKPVNCECLSRVSFAEERHQDVKIQEFTKQSDKLRLRYAILLKDHKPKTIHDLETMFEVVFKNAHIVFPLETIAFHLLEEVGEVTEALKDLYTYDRNHEKRTPEVEKYRKAKLEEEIADVFSWLFATLLKIRATYSDAEKYIKSLMEGTKVEIKTGLTERITFSELIWRKYGRSKAGDPWESLKCPRCERAECECDRDLLIQWKGTRVGSHPDASRAAESNSFRGADGEEMLILSALYGIGKDLLDVTDKVAATLAGGAQVVANNQLAGVDPKKDVPKFLTVVYQHRGIRGFKAVPEHATLTLP